MGVAQCRRHNSFKSVELKESTTGGIIGICWNLAARQAADKCLSSRMLEIIKYKKDSFFIVIKRLNSKSYVYSVAIYFYIYART